MTGGQAAFRFGQDGPSRITVATAMYTEASEIMPYEPSYGQVVPFLSPTIVDGGTVTSMSGTSVSGDDDYDQYPGQLDLKYWQGDDFIVPLEISDADNPDLDLSAAGGCEWAASVRAYHDRGSAHLYDFAIASTFTANAGTAEDPGVTTVKLFLPRSKNRYVGAFSWDLQVTIPEDLSEFPQPADVADEDWPPVDRTRTFVYGTVYVVPEVTRGVPFPRQGTTIRLAWPNGRVP